MVYVLKKKNKNIEIVISFNILGFAATGANDRNVPVTYNCVDFTFKLRKYISVIPCRHGEMLHP